MLSGAIERVGDYEHAVRLGAGKEALLGFVEGALRTGRGHDASVYAAACRYGLPLLCAPFKKRPALTRLGPCGILCVVHQERVKQE